MTRIPKCKVQSRNSLERTSVRSAFTLIEIMVVVAIMAIVMLTSIPFIRSGLHKEALGETVREVEEVCASARRKAILQGAMAEIVFRPRERTFQVAGGAAGPSDATPASLDATTAPPANSGLSGKISDSLVIDMLDVNLTEYKESEEARVRFYPNGTSDELTLIIHNEKGQYFKIALEAVTGLPTFETDPSKFKLQ